jgi:hypothetical protein
MEHACLSKCIAQAEGAQRSVHARPPAARCIAPRAGRRRMAEQKPSRRKRKPTSRLTPDGRGAYAQAQVHKPPTAAAGPPPAAAEAAPPAAQAVAQAAPAAAAGGEPSEALRRAAAVYVAALRCAGAEEAEAVCGARCAPPDMARSAALAGDAKKLVFGVLLYELAQVRGAGGTVETYVASVVRGSGSARCMPVPELARAVGGVTQVRALHRPTGLEPWEGGVALAVDACMRRHDETQCRCIYVHSDSAHVVVAPSGADAAAVYVCSDGRLATAEGVSRAAAVALLAALFPLEVTVDALGRLRAPARSDHFSGPVSVPASAVSRASIIGQ